MEKRSEIMDWRQWGWCLLFLLGAFVVDRAVGFGLTRTLTVVDVGQRIGLANAAIKRTDAEIVVFGTSRARHQVMPSVLEEATGCSVYNAGLNGQGLYYHRILEELMLAEGSQAKLFLLLTEAGSLQYDGAARAMNMTPFVDRDEDVDRLVREVTHHADLKLMSRAYRFNGTAFSIVAIALTRRGQPNLSDGFVPKRGRLAAPGGPPVEVDWLQAMEGTRVQPRLIELNEEFVAVAREAGVDVVFFSGPRLARNHGETEAYAAIRAIAATARVPMLVVDERHYPEFLDESLFRDRAHLNPEGAERFTRRLAEELTALDRPALRCGGGSDDRP